MSSNEISSAINSILMEPETSLQDCDFDLERLLESISSVSHVSQVGDIPLPAPVPAPIPAPISAPVPTALPTVVIDDSGDEFEDSPKIIVHTNIRVPRLPAATKRLSTGKVVGTTNDGSKPAGPLVVAPKTKKPRAPRKPRVAPARTSLLVPSTSVVASTSRAEPSIPSSQDELSMRLNSAMLAMMNHQTRLTADREQLDITRSTYKQLKMEVDEEEKAMEVASAPIQYRLDELVEENSRIQLHIADLQRQLEEATHRQHVVRQSQVDAGIEMSRVKEAHPGHEERKRACETMRVKCYEMSERAQSTKDSISKWLDHINSGPG